MSTVTLKATFESSTRRFPIDSHISFEDLHEQLEERFSASVPFVVTYEDADKDTITVDSDIELTELISTSKDASAPVRVFLFSPDDAKRASEVTRSAPTFIPPQGDVANLRIPQLETLIGSVSELISAMKPNRATGMTPAPVDPTMTSPEVASRGARDIGDSPMTDSATANKGPRKGVFAGIRHYMSAFPSGKPGFKKHAASVSPEAKIAFKKLVRYIKNADNTSDIVHALKDIFPIFRKWLTAELGDEGLPDPEKVNAIVDAVQEALLPKVGDPTTKRVTDFVRIALADEGIVSILRKVRAIGPMPWEDGFSLSRMGKQGPRGFNVHHKIHCSSCGMKPIVGSRFKCTNRKNFNLCNNCYHNDDVAKDDMQFTECKYVWDNVLVDVKVPPAPLKVGDRGPKVKFLHKILTDLGFMNEGMYARQMGLYGPNTKAAVEQFQSEQNIGSACDSGVYDEATAESLASVVEARDMDVVDSTVPAETSAMEV